MFDLRLGLGLRAAEFGTLRADQHDPKMVIFLVSAGEQQTSNRQIPCGSKAGISCSNYHNVKDMVRVLDVS